MLFRSLPFAFVLAAGLAAALPTSAQDIEAGDLLIADPISRPVMTGRTAAVYLSITNNGDEEERLLAASSSGFDAVELHESYEEDGVSKMRPVEAIEIPAGDTALLEPGGLHLMLFGAHEAVAAGEEFPLVLSFENAGEVEMPVMVDETSGGADDHDHHDHDHHDHEDHDHDEHEDHGDHDQH